MSEGAQSSDSFGEKITNWVWKTEIKWSIL